MSNIPHYLLQSRKGVRLGNGQLVDGLLFDGLWDPFGNQHMGNIAEGTASKYGISRQEQDDYAILSYSRAKSAVEKCYFQVLCPFSITRDEAPPPPLQMVARPSDPSCTLRIFSKVARIRAPDAPIGWPRATAPP